MIVNSKHIEKPDKKMQFGKQGILFHASSTMTYGLSASASVSRFWPKGHVLPAYAVEVLETDASVAP